MNFFGKTLTGFPRVFPDEEASTRQFKQSTIPSYLCHMKLFFSVERAFLINEVLLKRLHCFRGGKKENLLKIGFEFFICVGDAKIADELFVSKFIWNFTK